MENITEVFHRDKSTLVYFQTRTAANTDSCQVISLGGQIGAGLFISTGKNLADGGPASLFLGFFVVCTCVFAVLQTVSEMTIAFPVSGNFIDYADRFVDPALSFAAGFAMWLGWTAIIAAEAKFFSVVVNYWALDRINEAVWCKFAKYSSISFYLQENTDKFQSSDHIPYCYGTHIQSSE